MPTESLFTPDTLQSPVTALLATVFIASIVGSPHCAGMCGGFVAYFSGKSNSAFRTHLAYHLGRLITYSLLGVAAGFAGRALDSVGDIAGLQRVTLIITGVLLIYWGFRELLGKSRVLSGEQSQNLLFKKLSKAFQSIFRSSLESWTLKAFLIGALSTFLPCGWLHVFSLGAAATADPLRGALVMAAFWAGTVPILATVGGITKVLASRFRVYIPRLTAVLLIIAGLFSLFGRFDRLFLNEGSSPPCHHQSMETGK